MPSAGKLTIDIDAGTSAFLLDMNKANASIRQFGQAGQESGIHVVSSVQAASAAIRLMEGDITHNVRAVEKLVSMFPALSKAVTGAFPLVAGAAFVGLIGSMTVKVVEFFQKMEDAPRRMAAAFNGLNQPLALTNDELAVANDKLAMEIAKLEGKPQNGIKLAIDEAVLSAAKLGEELDKDLERITKVMTENKTPAWQIFTPGTAPADKRANQLRTQVSQDSGNPAAQLQDFQHELQNVQADLVKALAANAPKSVSGINEGGLAGGHNDAQVSRLKEYATQYQGEVDRIKAILQQSKLEQQKTLDETAEENAAKAKEGARQATEALRQGDQDQMAELEASHELALGEIIGFWQKRLATESGNADRVREINITLGHLYQEQGRAVVEAQNQLNEAAEKLYEKNQRVAESNEQLANSFAKAADGIAKYNDEAAKSEDEKLTKIPLAQRVASSANEPTFVSAGVPGYGRTTQTFQYPAIQPPGAPGGGALAAATAITGPTLGSRQSSISEDQRQLQLLQSINAPLVDQLAVREKILEAEIALAQVQGQNASALQIQLTNAQALQKVKQWGQIGAGTAYGDAMNAAMQLPQAIGNALASSIFGGGRHHESAGKRITGAAEGVGKNALGQLFTHGIQGLLGHLGHNIGAASQTAAITANTTALAANTAALTVGAATSAVSGAAGAAGGIMGSFSKFLGPLMHIFGFAGGGDPPVGHASLVGERGAELFVPKQAGTIIPNHMLRSGAYANRSGPVPSSGNSNYSSSVGELHFHAHGIDDPDDLVDMMAKKLPGRLKSTSPVFGPSTA